MKKTNGEVTVKESLKIVKDLLKKRKHLGPKSFTSGNLIFTQYTAKYKQLVYDRTPLVLILKNDGFHVLGINFHWMPYRMRLSLIRDIINMNRDNIAKGKPLDFSYKDIKMFLKNKAYYPCVRKYILKRFNFNGVIVSPENLLKIAKLNTATFTHGVTSRTMYLLAKHKKI